MLTCDTLFFHSFKTPPPSGGQGSDKLVFPFPVLIPRKYHDPAFS